MVDAEEMQEELKRELAFTWIGQTTSEILARNERILAAFEALHERIRQLEGDDSIPYVLEEDKDKPPEDRPVFYLRKPSFEQLRKRIMGPVESVPGTAEQLPCGSVSCLIKSVSGTEEPNHFVMKGVEFESGTWPVCCNKEMTLNDTSKGKFYACECGRAVDSQGRLIDHKGDLIEEKNE